MTTCILLAAACFLPALIVSIGRCYREKDLLTSAMVFLCAIMVATFVSAFFQADYILSLFDTYGLSIMEMDNCGLRVVFVVDDANGYRYQLHNGLFS